MELFSLFIGVVFAAEGIISPIQEDVPGTTTVATKPSTSFGQLPSSSVLGVSIEEPTPTPKETRKTKKSSYTIAVLGDSMVDTLGPGVPHLANALKKIYPRTQFTIYNYGVGGTNIDYGLQRLTSDYLYLDNPIPALVNRHPDIVVVESFGYNPYTFDAGALEKHWLQLAAIVDTLKNRIPNVKIIIAATIAPDATTFGDGAAGLAFSPEDKRKRTAVIKQYLESTVHFAQSQHLPLADAYTPSLIGTTRFINAGDHIHPSDDGKKLFAQKVTEAILSLSM
ncbi:hypothetical protein A2875_02240 [Candidatus Gottesmanbacteria bacterium RIFCSPHIGHO2_01_FULL_46_14]|uniref:SGNH hydrolase-type esterase domain-containing protein n=2 Tax=Candidatus Gottesmaniibacteriota TaxID=1752720 RepID=A0A1F5ZJR9_9BACT|nr:MAG: hypothetical protein A2875_02240 [Candidatus Gottesmanbacteria bacterium RIFCSPHIGHO2_01_FULL_46_14]OGG28746.1 MAG: hypothetical protein A2971_00270 [Candidatus Gottesmanbacteria bacterium RIFCSPLOWO2_01_FULL_46_21]